MKYCVNRKWTCMALFEHCKMSSSKFFRLIGDNIVYTNICVLSAAIFVKCLRLIQNKFIQYFSLATVFILAKQHDIKFFCFRY